MKKSNWIVMAALVVASGFLLWLWYFLGFNRIDSPLDLVLSIVWWAVILIGVIAIWRVEKARRDRIRTIYVNGRGVFNSEAGMRPYSEPAQLVGVMAGILDNLQYDFTKNDLPDQGQFPVDLLVKTSDYGSDTWEGEVVEARSRRELPFRSKEELFRILAGQA